MKRSKKFFNRHNIFALFSLVMFSGLIALGIWQLQRLEWKESLIETNRRQLALPAITLPLRAESLEDATFRRVKIEGAYLHEQEILIGAKYYNGKIGFNLITPLLLNDNTIVLVNRGWLPQLSEEELQAQVFRPQPLVRIEGVIHASDKKGWFAPVNMPDKNQWYWIELPLLVSHIRQNNANNVVRPLLIQALEETKTEPYPIILTHDISVLNDHLHYALTWFALAGVVFFMYIAYVRKEMLRGKHP